MIDYTASKIARMEYEERVRSLAPVGDYDEWLTYAAGHWQAPSIGALLSSLGQGLAQLRNTLKLKPDVALEDAHVVQERSNVPG